MLMLFNMIKYHYFIEIIMKYLLLGDDPCKHVGI